MPREIPFEAKDLPLKADVSLLGAIIGEVVREQCGEDFFHRLERVRRAAIDRREGREAGTLALDAALGDADAAIAEDLVRAFSAWSGCPADCMERAVELPIPSIADRRPR